MSLHLLIALLAGCAGGDWRDELDPHWRQNVEAGTDFRHRTLFKPGHGDTLHIYLDGDGRIWRDANTLLPRPLTERSLALQLLREDPAPALLIGRPCYLDVDDARCEPRWWTSARYSESIVASLAAVAQHHAEPYRQVLLIGYSGGGALATLLAPRLPQTTAVITIAANLDTQAWRAQHRYSAAVIDESLDPARQPPLPARIAQWHYAGGNDTNVLPQWIERYAARQPAAHFILRDNFDHRCCWSESWAEMLTAATAQ